MSAPIERLVARCTHDAAGRRGRVLRLCLGIAAAALLAACSTFASRIAQYPDLFASLDSATQDNLRHAVVEIGYTTEMAYIAFGQPDEVRRTVRAGGESVTWLYQYSYPLYDDYGFVGFEPYFVHTHHGIRLLHYPIFYDRYRYEVRDYLRLEFVDGRITLIDRIDTG